MKIVIIDGQGGRIGSELTAALKRAGCAAEIIAVGTNSIATSAMMKAGADRGASGENPVCVTCRSADIIAGPMGIIAADSLLGEITPAMAQAVCQSRAQKVLVPVSSCGIVVAGTPSVPLAQSVAAAVVEIKKLLGE